MMNTPFKDAVWIWSNLNPQPDEYGEFVDEFVYENGKAILRISADSNYAVYLNGTLAACGQYADFPYDKVYDEIDVTDLCSKGRNRLAIIIWYYGIASSFTYYPGNAGLLYEMVCENRIICRSDEETLARISKSYMNHRMKMITSQLGLGYGYDATLEDDWMMGELIDFKSAARVEQKLPLRIRPCKRLTLLPEVSGCICKQISNTDVIYDLGKEQVGFLSFQLYSPCEQEIVIAFGEHLEDGCVRQIIGTRDFSITYKAKKGFNSFMNPFRRLGCRYLEIHSDIPVNIEKMAIVPTMYILEEKSRPALSEKQNKIYDMCVETLRLCAHEHYEDCPWREQSLYAMDSRNQMLCGYYAFEEYIFPRANLELISKDQREDGLLSICYPSKHPLAIPSFSLHYITACAEYLKYSGDREFLEMVYPKLAAIMEAFTSRMKEGLACTFTGKNYWNFYEWRDGLDAMQELLAKNAESANQDLVLNALLSVALQKLSGIAGELGIENDYCQQAEKLNVRIYQTFWDDVKGICYDRPEHKAYSQLGNALAILCGAVTGDEARRLCNRILTDSDMTPITISMQCFKYDAWLKTDKKKYAPVILEDIEKNYSVMVNYGSTTVWENDYMEEAGSLCHGWSALPIYYYHILL